VIEQPAKNLSLESVANERLPCEPTKLDRVVVIIPARNEEAALPMVLGDLPAVQVVIVVDNGSTDRTAEIAVHCGAQVVHEVRPGYGTACLAGLEEVNRHFLGESAADLLIIVFLDGDYSDYPNLLPELVQPILRGEADFVLGSRLRGEREPGAMPPQSIFGNRFACFLMRVLWGQAFTDLGPFRAIRFDRLRDLSMNDRDFGWTIEMQIKAVAAGLRIREIPVPYRRRIGVSKISGTVVGSAKAAVKILVTIAKYWWLLRRSRPQGAEH